ncbi:carbohydrate ABC transporter permease [Inhella gelatinilytica]|uniref:Carbohydrate ABC transporter permease n=1 Tax=Inhella gelatinilytica TaxID=2795030 RepID=A0A931IX04_9BURK|nr:carbohydrate ABC transporter permease [Inhella gelatinilytica]MBH9552614.1 carbohydrate ABC transporter permease [Inhella gelatinilytica]
MSRLLRHWPRYLALCAWGLFTIGPFLWLLSTALKGPADLLFANPPQWVPATPTLQNFERVLDSQPMFSYLGNSLAVAVLAVLCNACFASMAGYALARLEFRSKPLVFGALLASMMLPFQLLMIPVYQLALTLGLRNTVLGLVLPHACTAFGVLLMRQAFDSIPKALEEAAVMEGVGRWRIWAYVCLPLVRPQLATLAVFTFIAAWGDFLWPLILTDDPARFTLPLGVNRLAGLLSLDWRLVAAGAIFSLIPVLAMFALSQRFFIDGALKGAVKQ